MSWAFSRERSLLSCIGDASQVVWISRKNPSTTEFVPVHLLEKTTPAGSITCLKSDRKNGESPEGFPLDTESTVEFRALKGLGLLGEHTAIIHGAGLGSEDFRQMRASGTALIWSPRSDMELYGSTTNVGAAFRQGVTVALAPDWSPTGSTKMLAELQFARRLNHEQLYGLFSDRELFEMAIAIPARIAGIDDKVGSLQAGLFADLFVLAGDGFQPFAALMQARPEDVQLVLVGGVPIYGTEKLVSQFQVPAESVDVCKSKMLLNSAVLPAGKFADVRDRLKTDLSKYKLELGPLEECPH